MKWFTPKGEIDLCGHANISISLCNIYLT
nr:PhzF family phenazine biosynthesis protein [Psychrobacillus sp. AK 1817]